MKLEDHEMDQFLSSLPSWVQDDFFKDNYIYTVGCLVRAGKIKKEDFFPELAKLMMKRSKSLEKLYIEHFKLCNRPIMVAPTAPVK